MFKGILVLRQISSNNIPCFGFTKDRNIMPLYARKQVEYQSTVPTFLQVKTRSDLKVKYFYVKPETEIST